MTINTSLAGTSSPINLIDLNSGVELVINTEGSVSTRLIDGSGTALTSTLAGGKQGLDVNIIASTSLTGTVTANIGTTGGLALDTTVSALEVSQGSTTSGQKGILELGAVTTAAPSYTTGQTSPLSLTTSGSLRIDNSSWLGSTAPTVGQKTMTNSLPVVMASDQIPDTPEVPYVSHFTKTNKNYGWSGTINMTTGNTDNPLLLIRNPNASGEVMYIRFIRSGTAVSNVSAIFRIFITPTVTANGTAQTPVSLNVGGGAGAATMLINTLPTISANGSQLCNAIQGQNSNSVQFGEGFAIVLQANQTALLTGSPLSNNRAAEIAIHWTEL